MHSSISVKVCNLVVKSTIPTKSLSNHVKDKNKLFSVKFLNKKGKLLKNSKVKVKIKNKWYLFKTNAKGLIKFKINNFKKGKHFIIAFNLFSKEKRKITVNIR